MSLDEELDELKLLIDEAKELAERLEHEYPHIDIFEIAQSRSVGQLYTNEIYH